MSNDYNIVITGNATLNSTIPSWKDHSVFNLQEMEDNHCDNINLGDLLSFYSIHEYTDLLIKIKSKMRCGCFLIIQQYDLDEVSISRNSGTTNVGAFNKLVFNEGNHKSLCDISTLCEILQSLDLKIINKDLDSLKMAITSYKSYE